MRTLIVFLICLTSTFLAEAQDKLLVGTWKITECAYVTSSGTEKIMEDQIKAGTATTDYIIMEDGRYSLTSNMSGSGTLDTYEGTWKTSENKLITTLNVNNQSMEIEWKYELKDNILILSRTSPDGSMTIVNTYRKK